MPKIKKIRPNADSFHLLVLNTASNYVAAGAMTVEESKKWVSEKLESFDRGEFDFTVDYSLFGKRK